MVSDLSDRSDKSDSKKARETAAGDVANSGGGSAPGNYAVIFANFSVPSSSVKPQPA